MGSKVTRLPSSTSQEVERIKKQIANELGRWPTYKELEKELNGRLKR